jgi:hypothetical protein
MRFIPLSVLLAATTVGPVRATLQDALLAHALVADIADSRVVRIDRATGPVFGAAFTFEDCLWLYTAESGTRVLGKTGAAYPAADQLGATLRLLDSRVSAVAIYPHPPRPLMEPAQWRLNNSCVLAALASLAQLLSATDDVREAGLVLLSYRTANAEIANGMLVDHCLLVVRGLERWECVDPADAHKVFPLQWLIVGKPIDPAIVDRTFRDRYPLKTARLLAIDRGTLERIRDSALWRVAARAHGELPAGPEQN